MAVLKSNILEKKYKTYFIENIKGKNGIIKPITKVTYIKQCPQCGGDLKVREIGCRKSSNGKVEWVRWQCPDNNCKHLETEY
jgi:hypothetical protein